MSAGKEDQFAEFRKELSTPSKPKRAKKAENGEEKPKEEKKKAKRGRPPKPKLSAKEKFIESIMHRAGCEKPPTIKQLFVDHSGQTMKIKDIGIFISDEPGDPLLNELAKQLPIRNTVNLSAEVSIGQVRNVGVQILEIGRAWMPINVAKLKDGSKNFECWSGRHRLTFLALMFGPETEVPIEVRNYTTQEARDAAIYANKCRSIQGLERAEHRALKATEGAAVEDVERDKLYEKMAKVKAGASEFAIVSLLSTQVHGLHLQFEVSPTSSRGGGKYLTTVIGLKGFIGAAVEWSKDMTRTEFDKVLKSAITYLNEVVGELKKIKEFDPKQQLASKPLIAIGRLYTKLVLASKSSPAEYAPLIAKILVELGEIGRNKSEETLKKLIQRIKEEMEKTA